MSKNVLALRAHQPVYDLDFLFVSFFLPADSPYPSVREVVTIRINLHIHWFFISDAFLTSIVSVTDTEICWPKYWSTLKKHPCHYLRADAGSAQSKPFVFCCRKEEPTNWLGLSTCVWELGHCYLSLCVRGIMEILCKSAMQAYNHGCIVFHKLQPH